MGICRDCGSEFNRGQNAKFCKDCSKKRKDDYKIRYRQTHTEEIKKYREKYNNEHKEQNKAYKINYCQERREHLCKKSLEYHYLHRDEENKKAREYFLKNKERYASNKKNFILKNPDYNKTYNETHKEQKKEWDKAWRENNKDKVIIRAARYRTKKRNLPNTLTEQDWAEILKTFNNECAYCGSTEQLAQDHFMPLNKNGEYTHNNIIPACKKCNSSKQDKSFFEWYPKQPHYSEQRETKILKALNYKKEIQQLRLMAGGY